MLFLLTGCFVFSQDKVHSINLDEITEVVAFVQISDEAINEMSINEKPDVDKIVDFLRTTDFKYVSGYEIASIDERSAWKVKLTFKAQRDEMYFFEEHAFIGKSTFLIPTGTTKKLLKLIGE